MKRILLVFMVLLNLQTLAQSLNDIKTAHSNSNKSIQAIHSYPQNIRYGNCHWVPVSTFKLSGTSLKIVETWTNGYGTTSRTVLEGKVRGNIVTGTWESDYSSGSWSYDFEKNTGKWNKTSSMFGSFYTMYPLVFKIVDNEDLRDGEYSCK